MRFFQTPFMKRRRRDGRSHSFTSPSTTSSKQQQQQWAASPSSSASLQGDSWHAGIGGRSNNSNSVSISSNHRPPVSRSNSSNHSRSSHNRHSLVSCVFSKRYRTTDSTNSEEDSHSAAESGSPQHRSRNENEEDSHNHKSRETAPWRAGNFFKNGPPQESDWWVREGEESESSKIDSESSSLADSFLSDSDSVEGFPEHYVAALLRESTASLDSQPAEDEAVIQITGLATPTATVATTSKSLPMAMSLPSILPVPSPVKRNHSSVLVGNLVFRNCGLEAWKRGRKAWRERPAQQTYTRTNSMNLSTTFRNHHNKSNGASNSSSNSFSNSPGSMRRRNAWKKDLARKMSAERQYELPYKINLKEMVELFQEVWHGDDTDE